MDGVCGSRTTSADGLQRRGSVWAEAGPQARRNHLHTRHDHALARAPDRGQVDLQDQGCRTAGADEEDQVPERSDGQRPPDLGLLPHPGRAQVRRASSGKHGVRQCAERQRDPASTRGSVFLAVLPQGPEGAACCHGLLLRRGLDAEGAADLLRTVCHQSQESACSCGRAHDDTQRGLHGTGRTQLDRLRGWFPAGSSHPDL